MDDAESHAVVVVEKEDRNIALGATISSSGCSLETVCIYIMGKSEC